MTETTRGDSIPLRRARVSTLALAGLLWACAPTIETIEDEASGGDAASNGAQGGGGGSALGADGGIGQGDAVGEPTCPTSERYVNGECQCLPGLERCTGACVSLANDALHCGACDNSCGDEQCGTGQCQCHAGSADCDPEEGLQCRSIRDDVQNCGGCGHACPSASTCTGEACDSDVQSVRLFATESTNSIGGFENPVVMDEHGDLYIGFNAHGEHRVLPDGRDPLWTKLAAVAKLDVSGSPLWVVPSTGLISAVARYGNDVWVCASRDSEALVFGDKTYDLAAGHYSVVVVAKLDGATGALLEEHRFDSVNVAAPGGLLVDQDGAWFNMVVAGYGPEGSQSQDAVDYDGQTFIPPDPLSQTALFRLGSSSAPRWFPGVIHNLRFDDQKRIVVAAGVGTSPVNLGGDTFTAGGSGSMGVVRYTKALVHEASFLATPNYVFDDDGTTAVLPYLDSALFVGGPDVLFKRYAFDGSLLGQTTDVGFPLHLTSASVKAARVFLTGFTAIEPTIFGGRTFPGNYAPFFAAADLSGQVRAAFAFSNQEPNLGASPGPCTAVSADLRSVAMSIPFQGPFHLGGQTFAEDGLSGVAVVRVGLPAP